MATELYVCIYIRRPLQSVERVRLHLQAPKQAASQAARQPARQPGSQDLAVDCRIWQLTAYLSSYRGLTPLQKVATGVHTTSDPEPPHSPLGPQIGAPACTGVPNTSLLWLPWRAQCTPNPLKPCRERPGSARPPKAVPRIAATPPTADFLRGRRQRR